MQRPFATLAFCILVLVVVPSVSLASWDWVDMMGPLKDHQASVAPLSSEQALYDVAKKGNWWGRTSAILRLGELATPKSCQVLCKLYSEWPADRVLDSPPDVSFFTLAALGSTRTAMAHAYLEQVVGGLAADSPVPVVADTKDRWLGALKGLSYFADASHVRLCENIANNPIIGMAVREWVSECAAEMELSMRGLSSPLEKAKVVLVELEASRLSTLKRRAMERRLVAYAKSDAGVEAMLSARARSVKDRDKARAYGNMAELARLSRSNPRTGNPADRLGRF